jgi:hypothetical protein
MDSVLDRKVEYDIESYGEYPQSRAKFVSPFADLWIQSISMAFASNLGCQFSRCVWPHLLNTNEMHELADICFCVSVEQHPLHYAGPPD